MVLRLAVRDISARTPLRAPSALRVALARERTLFQNGERLLRQRWCSTGGLRHREPGAARLRFLALPLRERGRLLASEAFQRSPLPRIRVFWRVHLSLRRAEWITLEPSPLGVRH